jgi:threonine aldolase
MAGSADLIEQAWRYKQMWGGSFRQSGFVAAGCLYALDNNVERQAEDHENARFLAEGLAEIPGVEIDPSTVETNIVIFDVPDAKALIRSLAGEVDLSTAGAGRRVRAVTHLDVSRADVEHALGAIRAALQNLK